MGGLVHAIALRALYSDSLSIARRTESRKDGAARSSSSIEDGDRKVLTSDGGCVNKGSASSSSSSTNDAPSAARGVVRGGRNMVMLVRSLCVAACERYALTRREATQL